MKRSFRPVAKQGAISEVKNSDWSEALAELRIYNPSIGRFLSVDPLTKSYPMLTPYQFASNTPIWAVDLDGLEALISTGGEPATVNMTARDGTSTKVPLDIRKFGEPKVNHSRTQPTISLSREDKLKQSSRDRQVWALNTFVANPQNLKEGDPIEWLGVLPIGKGFKLAKKVDNFVDLALDASKAVDNSIDAAKAGNESDTRRKTCKSLI